MCPLSPPPRCSRRAHQRTHQLARPGLRSSMMKLMMVMVSWSKSCQKVEKPQRLEKSQRLSVQRNVYRSTDPPSIRYEELELLIKALSVFSSSFAGPRSFFDTTSGAITDKAKLVELLMLCYVFLGGTKKIFKSKTLKSFISRNQRSLCSKVFICATHVFPLILQLWDIFQAL